MPYTKTIIGYDAKRITHNATGLGNYGRTLVNALSPMLDGKAEMLLFSPDRGRDELRKQVVERENIHFVYSQTKCLSMPKSLWRTFGMARDAQERNVAIFHGLTGELPKGLRQRGIHGVVTIHDLIFMRHPEYYKPVDVALYKWKFRLACREAERIIAISERTKRDIMELGGYPEERIDVVYQSCDTRFAQPVDETKMAEVRRRYSLPDRYILNVGTVERRKNALLTVRAMTQTAPDAHLIIIGRQTDYAREVMREARNMGVAERVRMLKDVPNEDLAAIYRAATVFVYPSRYEGFGIPIIEAAQADVPIVAATGSCLEEAGGPNSLYVNPDDVRGTAEAINSLLADSELRESCTARTRDYVRRFENTNTAAKVIEVYDKLVSLTTLRTLNS